MIRRAIGWGLRRFGAGPDGPVRTGARAVRAAWPLLQPRRLERPLAEALTLEADDPEGDFLVWMASMPGVEPGRLAVRARRQAWLHFVAGLASMTLLAGLSASVQPWYAVGAIVAGLAMCVAGLRADLVAWQIERRRCEAPAAYLRRLPCILWR